MARGGQAKKNEFAFLEGIPGSLAVGIPTLGKQACTLANIVESRRSVENPRSAPAGGLVAVPRRGPLG